jgi:hypothetical protein
MASHILEAAEAERQRAVFDFSAPNGGGYAFVDGPVRTLPTKQVSYELRADAYANVRAEVADELILADLEGECDALLAVTESSLLRGVERKPLARLLQDLEATHLDDWLRLLAVCPVADQATVALNMQDWLMSTMRASHGIAERSDAIAARRLKL